MQKRRRAGGIPVREIPARLREILELAREAEVKLSGAVALAHDLPLEEREQVRERLWHIRQHLRDQVARFGKEVERVEEQMHPPPHGARRRREE